jgi:hypothetical protein
MYRQRSTWEPPQRPNEGTAAPKVTAVPASDPGRHLVAPISCWETTVAGKLDESVGDARGVACDETRDNPGYFNRAWRLTTTVAIIGK